MAFLSDKTEAILDRSSFFLFGHGLTKNMRQFLGHVSWSFFGGVVASAVLLSVSIFAGRVLGPEEYGKFNVVWTISQILVVFFCFGVDYSSTRFILRKNDLREKYLSASIYLLIFITAIFSSAILLSLKEVSKILSIDSIGLRAAIFLGIVFALKQALDSGIRGFQRFKLQSVVKVVEALVVVLAFVLFYNRSPQYSIYVYSLITGAIVVVVAYATSLRKFFVSLDTGVLREVFSYGKYLFLAAILGIAFQSADKLLINKYLSYSDVGIYSAYYMATVTLFSQAALLFNNVFYPLVSRSRDNMNVIIKKLDRVSLIFFVPGTILAGVVLIVALSLYGSSYPVDPYLVIGFSVLAILQAIVAVNVSVVIAHSERAVKAGIIYGNLVSLAIAFVYVLLIRNNIFSMYSLVVALILYYLLTLVMQKYVQAKLNMYR